MPVPETTDEVQSAPDKSDEPDRLTIEYPLKDITDEVLANLRKMVAAKAPLLKKALGAEELPILLTEHSLKFPWFSGKLDGDTVGAYAQFIACLCETAKRKKRVTAQTAVVVRAMRETKTMDKLKEIRRKEYAKKENKAHEQFIEEFVMHKMVAAKK